MLFDFEFGFLYQACFLIRNFHVRNTYRYGSFCGILEPKLFDMVKHKSCNRIAVPSEALVYDYTKLFLCAQEIDFKSIFIFASVYKSEVLRYVLIEYESSNRSLDKFTFVFFVQTPSHFNL